eukprot:TRINITY_DN79054_c0_g1_i1.p1 TRINITY_DN79054_c0_g1~~TRINITY_DN79054_c0_g1_i1.p1  ORF type:complete len:535 (+),score=85.15 TRINITY_DN79054_c0_g1_i1:120-1724(+)
MMKAVGFVSLGSLGALGDVAGIIDDSTLSLIDQGVHQAGGGSQDTFTANPLCIKNNCINPVFPALADLHAAEKKEWFCTSRIETRASQSFCKAAVNYDFAIQKPETQAEESIEAMVRKQDKAANSAYVYHLSGMGIDAWDHPDPENGDDECVKAVYKMACYSHFPRAKPGCKTGDPIAFIRPCRNSCENYVSACEIECCDNSVQCIFEHKKRISSFAAITQKGYVDRQGPSAYCTGAAGRTSAPGILTAILLLLAMPLGSVKDTLSGIRGSMPGARIFACFAVLAAMSVSLQGCDGGMEVHTTALWRRVPDYNLQYQFIPPGSSEKEAVLNSCAVAGLPATAQCSGHGRCVAWGSTSMVNPTLFCKCDAGWADPECRTQRKSQLVSYFLAVFLGFFGLDRFYLGLTISGTLKLITLTGSSFLCLVDYLSTGEAPIDIKDDLRRWGGVFKLFIYSGLFSWYVMDIVRTGSAPVMTAGAFKVTPDLSHTAFVVFTMSWMSLIGGTYGYLSVVDYLHMSRKKVWKQWQNEEAGIPVF